MEGKILSQSCDEVKDLSQPCDEVEVPSQPCDEEVQSENSMEPFEDFDPEMLSPEDRAYFETLRQREFAAIQESLRLEQVLVAQQTQALTPSPFVVPEYRAHPEETALSKELPVQRKCANSECGDMDVENLKRCKRCNETEYCSKQCQKIHWRAHMRGCCANGRAN